MSAPPSYKDLAKVAEDYLTKGSTVRGWTIDAKEDGVARQLNVFPFANERTFGMHMLYEYPDLHLTLSSKVSAVVKSWREYLPTIKYQRKLNAAWHTHEVDLAASTLKWSGEHPVWNATATTNVTDGFSTNASVTTRVSPDFFVGGNLIFDPSRSGVRDLTAIAVRYACPNIRKGDLMGMYNIQNGFSVHMRVPVQQYTDVAVIAERRRFIAGVQARSPCGAQLMLNANVTEGTATLTAIRNISDIWKVTMTYTTPVCGAKATASSPSVPRFGLRLSNMDSTD